MHFSLKVPGHSLGPGVLYLERINVLTPPIGEFTNQFAVCWYNEYVEQYFELNEPIWRFSLPLRIFVDVFPIFPSFECEILNHLYILLPSSVSASQRGGNWRWRVAESQLRQEVDACSPREAWTNWESEFDKAELNFRFPRLGGTPGWTRCASVMDFPTYLCAESINICKIWIISIEKLINSSENNFVLFITGVNKL